MPTTTNDTSFVLVIARSATDARRAVDTDAELLFGKMSSAAVVTEALFTIGSAPE
ncbi:hypothetical protein D3C83_310200 [compost metagenome]